MSNTSNDLTWSKFTRTEHNRVIDQDRGICLSLTIDATRDNVEHVHLLPTRADKHPGEQKIELCNTHHDTLILEFASKAQKRELGAKLRKTNFSRGQTIYPARCDDLARSDFLDNVPHLRRAWTLSCTKNAQIRDVIIFIEAYFAIKGYIATSQVLTQSPPHEVLIQGDTAQTKKWLHKLADHPNGPINRRLKAFYRPDCVYCSADTPEEENTTFDAVESCPNCTNTAARGATMCCQDCTLGIRASNIVSKFPDTTRDARWIFPTSAAVDLKEVDLPSFIAAFVELNGQALFCAAPPELLVKAYKHYIRKLAGKDDPLAVLPALRNAPGPIYQAIVSELKPHLGFLRLPGATTNLPVRTLKRKRPEIEEDPSSVTGLVRVVQGLALDG